MSFLSRLGKAASAFGGALKAPIGLTSDLVTAPFKDDETDGFFGTIGHVFAKRTGETLRDTVGPQGVGGEAIGAIPKPVRDVGNDIIQPTLKGLDWVYTNAVSRPISTFTTVSQMSEGNPDDSRWGLKFRDFGAFADPNNWKAAYKISEVRSPGQALTLDAMGTDITNPDELNQAVGTDTYKVLSGSLDGFSRLYLDPSNYVGGAVIKGARVGKQAIRGETVWADKSIQTAADRNKFAGSTQYQKFQEDTLGKDSTYIRDKYFPKNEQGPVISTLLADAKTSSDHKNVTLALMGDFAAKQKLARENAGLNGALERALSQGNVLRDRAGTLWESENDADKLADLDKQVEGIYGQEASRWHVVEQGAQAGFAPIREVPGYGIGARLRDSLGHETILQKNPLSAVVRKATAWKPGGGAGMVNLHRPDGDVELGRFLDKSNIAPDTIQKYRDEYMRAGDELTKSQIWSRAEADAVRSLVPTGMSIDDVEQLVQTARSGKDRAHALVNNVKGRVYDGEGRSRINFKDPESGEMVDIPLLVSQNENVHIIRDLDEVKKSVNGMGQYMARHPHIKSISELPTEMMEGYQRLWKPATLLRLGWPVRVIADEQLRVIAKIGVLAQADNIATAVGNKIHDTLRNVDKEMQIPGKRKFEYGDYQLQSAFGGLPGDARNLWVTANRASGAFDGLYGRKERDLLAKLRGETATGGDTSRQWTTVRADDPATNASYGSAWEHAVNNQIGKDEMARQFLAGKSVDDVTGWLQSAAGRSYARRNRIRRADPRQWAADVEDQVRRYTMDDDTIKQAALASKAKIGELRRITKDPAEMPGVHGEILEQSKKKGAIGKYNDFVNSAYEALGEKPSGFLSRNPYFDHVYRDEMKRMIGLHDGPRLTQEQLDKMAHSARQYSLAETKKLLYDLGERSDLEGTLRFISPFYGAWQEVLSRWSGLAVENPRFLGQLRQIWNSPERAGIVTDENGSQVYEDGSAVDVDGNATKAGKDRYVNLPIPKALQHQWPVIGGAPGKVGASFNKRSLNLLLQGGPGLGPLAQVPLNEIVKDNPDLEKSFKWALPFGTTQEVADLLMPVGLKRAHQAAQGEDNRTFANQMMRIYYDELTDYNLGKRPTAPTYEEAKSKATALSHLRTVSAYVMPFQAQYKSPYQPYIDSLRLARERQAKDPNALGVHPDGSPKTADEWFYETYGPEFFALSQSMSKSYDGVPPTLNGQVARGKYKDLIEKYPDLGSLIIGSEGAGEFMGSAYDAQFARKVGPGSSHNQRETPTFEDSTAGYQARAGWMEYSKFMDLLDAERVQRGLPNFNVKAASDLRNIKQQYVAKLGEKYPGWDQAFHSTDTNAAAKRLEGMRAIAADPKLAGRDDVQGLRDYLVARDAMVKQLDARRTTLEAAPDLQQTWDTMRSSLVEGNLAFQSLYYRYLENDKVTHSPGVQAKAKKSSLLNTSKAKGLS